MTFSLPRSGRFTIFAMALVYTGLTFGAATAPVAAQAKTGPYYTATLAASTDENRAVAGGVAWACKDDKCVANKGRSRPMRICRGLAREFGEVKSFVTQGKELDADKLAKCNGN